MAKVRKLEKVNFPIERDMVIYGNTYHYKINRGDTVKCIFCGSKFIANSKTSFGYDDGVYLTCPECSGKAEVCYYMGKVVRDAPANYEEDEEEEGVFEWAL